MANDQIAASKRSKVGRPRGINITETDMRILQRVANEGFQNFQELRKNVLDQYNRRYIWALLQRLVTKELLIECRPIGNRIAGWTISKKGGELLLSGSQSGMPFQPRPLLYQSGYEHDLILRETKEILCQSPCVTDWVPEHILKARVSESIQRQNIREKSTKYQAVPDATFNLRVRGTNFKSAFELELVQKSSKRLFHKIESHLINAEYNIVLFVVLDDTLKTTLWTIFQNVLLHSIPVKLKKQRNGLYFTTLQSLRNQLLQAPWQGETNTMILAKLSPDDEIISPDSVR